MENLITKHKVIWTNAAKMTAIPNASIDLVVTSPPYPMIEMWDSILGKQRASIKQALGKRNGMAAFEAMHTLLDKVWAEVFRIDRFGKNQRRGKNQFLENVKQLLSTKHHEERNTCCHRWFDLLKPITELPYPPFQGTGRCIFPPMHLGYCRNFRYAHCGGFKELTYPFQWHTD